MKKFECNISEIVGTSRYTRIEVVVKGPDGMEFFAQGVVDSATSVDYLKLLTTAFNGMLAEARTRKG